MKRYFFEQIKQRIIERVPEVKTIGLFNNQISKSAENNPIGFPAVFVEFETIDWQSQQRGIQVGPANVKFYIAVETYKTNLSGEKISESNDLDFLDLVAKIHVGINGFDNEKFGPLLRVSENQDSDHDNVLVWETVYKTQFVDDGAETRYSKPLIEYDPTTDNDFKLTISTV